MEKIKKFESVIFWENGEMERGRILDIALKEDEYVFYVENLQTHKMLTLSADMVYKESDCR